MKTLAQGMKIRRQLTGVLCGFFDGYASRHSDYDGFWIIH